MNFRAIAINTMNCHIKESKKAHLLVLKNNFCLMLKLIIELVNVVKPLREC